MSGGKKTGKKGFETEEIVRSYFLASGFFAVRGARYRNGGDDLTDIDLWLYERSATLARRRIIIDIKDNAAPKAAERLFFVKGLAELLSVEATGIATSDTRKSLRDLARRHNVLWIDNVDLQRLKSSQRLSVSTRISDEEFDAKLSKVDQIRASKMMRELFIQVKSSVIDRFGPSCANTALDAVQQLSKTTLEAHPNSPAAEAMVRLIYFCSAIAAAALDFASGETALRPQTERLENLTAAIRLGNNPKGTEDSLRWAEAAIREFVPNGAGVAQLVRTRFNQAMQLVQAESLAEVIVKMSNSERLFNAARELEQAAYSKQLCSFDSLSIESRSFFGAVLDFCEVDRLKFAKAWDQPNNTGPAIAKEEVSVEEASDDEVSTKFEDGKLL